MAQKRLRDKSYADVVLEYEFHLEAKCAHAEGNAREKQTVGLLQRRKIQISGIKYIGKESNLLEGVEAGMIHSGQSVYTEYLTHDRMSGKQRFCLRQRKMPLGRLVKLSGMSRSSFIEIRAGRSRPHGKNQIKLGSIAAEPSTGEINSKTTIDSKSG